MIAILIHKLSLALTAYPSLTLMTLGAALPLSKFEMAIAFGLPVLGALAYYCVVFIWGNVDRRRRGRAFPAPPPTTDDIDDVGVWSAEESPPFADNGQRVFAELFGLPGPTETADHAWKLPADEVDVDESPGQWQVRVAYRGYKFCMTEVCDGANCEVNDPSCPEDTLRQFANHFEALTRLGQYDGTVWLTREFPQPIHRTSLAPRQKVVAHIASLPGATIIEPDSSGQGQEEFMLVRFQGSFFALDPGGVYHNAPENVFLEFAGHLRRLEDPTAPASEYAKQYEYARRPRRFARCLIVVVILFLLVPALAVLLLILGHGF